MGVIASNCNAYLKIFLSSVNIFLAGMFCTVMVATIPSVLSY